MIDLRDYSDGELSLIVYNDETLYNMRFDTEILKETIDFTFNYTNEQLNDLMNDINEELENEDT